MVPWTAPYEWFVSMIMEENPVATILHYACHGTTIGWQTELFTPDFPGPAREVVEREVGGMCLFLQGATANITPRRGFTGDLPCLSPAWHYSRVGGGKGCLEYRDASATGAFYRSAAFGSADRALR